MLDTLTSSTSVLTYKSLYSRVKGMIQSKFPQQLPMLMGNGDREVFGDKRRYKPYTVGVTKVDLDNQEITLDAGLAQGLSMGTRFAIYPFNCQELADKTKQIAIAELTNDIQADKSTAKILDADAKEKEKEQARQIFIQLVRVGEDNNNTRRLANRNQIAEGNWDLVTRKLQSMD